MITLFPARANAAVLTGRRGIRGSVLAQSLRGGQSRNLIKKPCVFIGVVLYVNANNPNMSGL